MANRLGQVSAYHPLVQLCLAAYDDQSGWFGVHYTPTGAIQMLPVSSVKKPIDAGNGWANPSDTVRMHVHVATCTCLDTWVDPGTAPPAACGGTAAVRRADPPPGPTPS